MKTMTRKEKAIEKERRVAEERERRRRHCKQWLLVNGKTQREVAKDLETYDTTVSHFIKGEFWSQRFADYFSYRRSLK